MSYEWGPQFIVPSETLRSFSGRTQLREELNDELLRKELDSLGFTGPVVRIVNPWYVRKVGEQTWIKIGESSDRSANFPVSWDTTAFANGAYEVLGFMHVFAKDGEREHVIARQNVVEVEVKN